MSKPKSRKLDMRVFAVYCEHGARQHNLNDVVRATPFVSHNTTVKAHPDSLCTRKHVFQYAVTKALDGLKKDINRSQSPATLSRLPCVEFTGPCTMLSYS